jgi:F-type H+-transporting ATPase subunit delta
MSGFIMTVVNKGRHKELSDILLHYMELVKEFKHIGTVYVTTPMELSQSEKDMIHSRLLNTTDYVSLEMNYDIDPSLIGGMVVRIGDRICDSSIKTKLSAIHKELSTVMLNQ